MTAAMGEEPFNIYHCTKCWEINAIPLSDMGKGVESLRADRDIYKKSLQLADQALATLEEWCGPTGASMQILTVTEKCKEARKTIQQALHGPRKEKGE